jgi:hypothetical protein
VTRFARGFRLTLPDGQVYDGAQLPNGFVVTAYPDAGLATVADSLDALLDGIEGADVEWADNAGDGGDGGAPA